MRLYSSLAIILLLLNLIQTLDLVLGSWWNPLQQTTSSTSSSSSITTTNSVHRLRLRPNRLRRPETCQTNLARKFEDLPVLVITGKLREVYEINSQQPANQSQPAAGTSRALVNIVRVLKGNQQLLGSDIIVSGFNSSNSNPCPNFIKPNDTLILLLHSDGDKKYSIQGGNALSMSLGNLDRLNAILEDEPPKRRGPIEDILCEAHYCPYGRCVVDDRNQTSCKCPETCPPLPIAPVCGSDNTTYTNECHLIREGCSRQRPLFVTKESAC